MTTDCIFCRIVAGEIPCHKVYENDLLMAFLDVQPLGAGHTLLIPKHHYPRLDQCPPLVVRALADQWAPLSRALQRATGTDSFNVLCNSGRTAGQLVDHVHFHIIPRLPNDGAITHAASLSMTREQMQQMAVHIRSLLE